MESLKIVTGLLKTVLKASEAAHAATETLNSAEEELVKFFNAMHQEISELEKESEKQKNYITELESENKNLLTEIEDLRKQFETNSEPVEIPEPVVTKEETPEN